MLNAVTTGLLLAGMLWVVQAPARAEEVRWRPAQELALEGVGWPSAEHPFRRLPAAAQGRVPDSVWGLAQDSAGVAVRFVTDAASVDVRWTLLSSELAMPHMPATGVSGVDLYVRTGRSEWAFVANGRPGAGLTHQMRAELPARRAGASAECLLYLPLYNGCRSVDIGVAAGRLLEPAPARPSGRDRAILFYGTSIVQGGCASRPGMAHTAIIGRMLDRAVINLGFSGSGRMEASVADVLAELDPAAAVIDCLWNVAGMPDADIAGRVTYLAEGLRRAHPSTPIVFVGQSSIHSKGKETQASRVQASAVEALRKKGMSGLHIVPGAVLLRGDEGTVDGVHPTDLGFQQHAEALAPVLKRLLGR